MTVRRPCAPFAIDRWHLQDEPLPVAGAPAPSSGDAERRASGRLRRRECRGPGGPRDGACRRDALPTQRPRPPSGLGEVPLDLRTNLPRAPCALRRRRFRTGTRRGRPQSAPGPASTSRLPATSAIRESTAVTSASVRGSGLMCRIEAQSAVEGKETGRVSPSACIGPRFSCSRPTTVTLGSPASYRRVCNHSATIGVRAHTRAGGRLARRSGTRRRRCNRYTHYVKGPEGHVAYQVLGSGSRDIVFVPDHPNNNRDHVGKSGAVALPRALGDDGAGDLLRQRGTGISDPVPLGAIPTIERWMDDITTVIDEVGCKRIVVFGHGDGGPIAMLFAATYPERTEALVLGDTFARMRHAADYPEGLSEVDADRKGTQTLRVLGA